MYIDANFIRFQCLSPVLRGQSLTLDDDHGYKIYESWSKAILKVWFF